jgi:hypothetical protein
VSVALGSWRSWLREGVGIRASRPLLGVEQAETQVATRPQKIIQAAKILFNPDFCNKIGPEETCRPHRQMSAICGEPDSTLTSLLGHSGP